jgi:hypothetical protein
MSRGKRAGILLSCVLMIAGCTPAGPIKLVLSDMDLPAEKSPPVVSLPPSSDVLIIGGISSGLKSTATAEFFHVQSESFLPTASLTTRLAGLNAVVLADGTSSVLVTGGSVLKGIYDAGTLTFTGSVKSAASLYDPQTGLFSAAGTMVRPRMLATATRLVDGSVLIAGGLDPLGTPQRWAEIYQPGTGKFTAVHEMHLARAMHSATLLGDGNVLIAGGLVDTLGTSTPTAEIYNPTTQKFTLLASNMVQSSSGHSATLITGCSCARDGQVLLADGAIGASSGGNQFELGNPAASLYNPRTRTFSAAANMPTDARVFHTATLIAGGKVLLAGGLFGDVLVGSGSVTGYTTNKILASAEIYDPVSSTFSCINGVSGFACKSSMKRARGGHVAILLRKGPHRGDVLLAGGLVKGSGDEAVPNRSTELYDPTSGKFVAFANMVEPRAFASAVSLP